MKKFNFISSYTTLTFKLQLASKNKQKIANILSRQFNRMQPMEALVTDLAYVQVGQKWHYVCFILDLFNREIVSYSRGPNKSVDLVLQAIGTIKQPLDAIEIFHTDRGKEFDYILLDSILHFYKNDLEKETKLLMQIIESMEVGAILINCLLKNNSAEKHFKKIVNKFKIEILKDNYIDYSDFKSTYHLYVFRKK